MLWIHINFGSGSMEPNQCGSIRIRVLIRLCRHKKLNFYIKKYSLIGCNACLQYVDTKNLSERLESMLFFGLFWSVSLLLNTDSDSQCQYGSGSRRVQSMRGSMRIRTHNTEKQRNGFLSCFYLLERPTSRGGSDIESSMLIVIFPSVYETDHLQPSVNISGSLYLLR